MSRFHAWGLFIATAAAFAGGQDAAGPAARPAGDGAAPPLELRFGQACGLPAGRQQAYDPQTGVFHVHFAPARPIGGNGSGLFKRSAFEVTKVHRPIARPVVFRLTGVPPEFGCVGDPLSLRVGISDGSRDRLCPDGKCYALVEDPLAQGPVDETLFRVERGGDVVTVAFTAKGQALLQPGALISFKMDTAW